MTEPMVWLRSLILGMRTHSNTVYQFRHLTKKEGSGSYLDQSGEPSKDIIWSLIFLPISKIRWNIVTIQGRSILWHSVCTYWPNQWVIGFQIQRSVLPSGHLHPAPKVTWEPHSEDKSVYRRIVQYFYDLWITTRPIKAPYPLNP